MKKLTIEQVIELDPNDFFKKVDHVVATYEYQLDYSMTIKFIRYPDKSTVKIAICGHNVLSSRSGFNFQRLKGRFLQKLDKPANLIYCSDWANT